MGHELLIMEMLHLMASVHIQACLTPWMSAAGPEDDIDLQARARPAGQTAVMSTGAFHKGNRKESHAIISQAWRCALSEETRKRVDKGTSVERLIEQNLIMCVY